MLVGSKPSFCLMSGMAEPPAAGTIRTFYRIDTEAASRLPRRTHRAARPQVL
jgi:hypothetical protein